MFEKLATFAYSNRRRVLFAAVVGAAVAGVFGAGVSNRLSPYGADDPATQSVQATNRFQDETGRQIDPGVVALVSSGDVHSPAAKQRVEGVAAELGTQPDIASVATFYTTHNRAMVARNGRSTYVIAYFKALSDKRVSDDAKVIESHFSAQPDVKLGGRRDRQRAGQLAGRQRPGTRRAAGVPDHLPALTPLLPVGRRGAAATAARWTGDPRHVLPLAGRLDIHRPVGVRDQPDDRTWARVGDRLQPVHRLALPRGGRPRRLRRRRSAPHPPDRRTHRAVQLGHGRVRRSPH